MNGGEIDMFMARLTRFTSKGVNQSEAESLADKLVIRDRDSDDRALCLERTHLGGEVHSSWVVAAGLHITMMKLRTCNRAVMKQRTCDYVLSFRYS